MCESWKYVHQKGLNCRHCCIFLCVWAFNLSLNVNLQRLPTIYENAVQWLEETGDPGIADLMYIFGSKIIGIMVLEAVFSQCKMEPHQQSQIPEQRFLEFLNHFYIIDHLNMILFPSKLDACYILSMGADLQLTYQDLISVNYSCNKNVRNEQMIFSNCFL